MGNPLSDAFSSEGLLFLGKAEQEHFAAIGMVASQWAFFEFCIDLNTLQLAMISEEFGLCITAQVAGSARKLDAYIALARQLGCTTKNSDLEKFAKDTVALGERRNRAIHDPWVVEQDQEPTRIEATARTKLRYMTISSPTSKIAQLAFEIMEHVSKFQELHAAIIEELRP